MAKDQVLELEVTLPDLHLNQHAVFMDAHRFVVLAAGRRWGKTLLGTVRSTECGAQGGLSWWVSPTYPLGAVGWRFLKTFAQPIPGVVIRESTRMIEYPGGGTSQVKSADNPQALRSEGLDLVVVDEVAHMPRFEEAWLQALRPALSDRKGRALFISTPFGYNSFFELFKQAGGDPAVLGFAGGQGDWVAYRYPAWDSPFIEESEMRAIKAGKMPALVFAQEHGAEFVQLAGALFKREYFERFLDEAPEGTYVRFWDFAVSLKKTADYTAGAKVALLDDGTLVIADITYGRWEWPDALKVINSTSTMDGSLVRQGLEDVGVQKGFIQQLMREPQLAHIAFKPIHPKGDKLSQSLALLARAEAGKVALVRGAWNKPFIDQACSFPAGAHDDMINAVWSGLLMLSSRKKVTTFFRPIKGF